MTSTSEISRLKLWSRSSGSVVTITVNKSVIINTVNRIIVLPTHV